MFYYAYRDVKGIFWSFRTHVRAKIIRKNPFLSHQYVITLISFLFYFFHISSICKTINSYLFWSRHLNFIKRKMWKDPSSNHWSYEMQHVSMISRLRLSKNCEKRKGNFAPLAVGTFKQNMHQSFLSPTYKASAEEILVYFNGR